MGKKMRMAAGAGIGACAAIGVATMTPLFAAAGVITLAGAGISGVFGILAGSGVAYATDPEDAVAATERRTRNDTEARMKAKHDQVIEQLTRDFNAIRLEIGQHQERTQLQQAIYTIGVACLAHCRAATPENVMQMREFVFGATHDILSAKVEARLRKVAALPPTLKSAMDQALAKHPDEGKRFDEVVRLAVVLLDPDGEDGLAGQWKQLRATGGAA